MTINLRRLEQRDRKHFARWWRNPELLALTSGQTAKITDQEVDRYFSVMLQSRADRHYIIEMEERPIGHIALIKRRGGWYETQIVIGSKSNRGRGLGTQAIGRLLELAFENSLGLVYLEVRPDNMTAIRAYEKSGFVAVKLVEYPDSPSFPLTLRMEWSGKK